MTNPFEGRKLGGRQLAPQFPQRRAIRHKEGGKVPRATPPKTQTFRVDDPKFDVDVFNRRMNEQRPDLVRGHDEDAADADMNISPGRRYAPVLRYAEGGQLPGYLFGGLFEGTPGTSTTSQSGSSNTQVNDPTYNNLRTDVMQRLQNNIIDKPFTPYTGEAIAPLSADQNTAFSNIRSNQGNYSPFFNAANSSINNVAGMNPTSSGMGYINAAGQAPTGSEAASPFVQQASQTFPGSVDQYMSPYTQNVTDRIATLGARNLNEKLLPGINDTFTGGDAAQFGRERHADIAGRALRDTQESVLGQQAQALESGYATAGNLFNSDASRAAGLANTTGTLAQGDVRNTANLGTAAGNLTAQGIQTGLQTAGAQQGLGQATQAAAGTDANALATAGGIQQATKQNQDTFNYGQWQQAQNNDINRLQQVQALSQGWQLPTSSNYQSTGTTTQQQPQGSPAGQILGGALGLGSLAIPGAGGVSALGNIFGGMAGGGTGQVGGYTLAGSNAATSLPGMGSWGMPGVMAADGGQIPYAVGGMVPTIGQMRKRNAPQRGMAPTGMPGMPPMAPPGPMPRQPNGQMQSPFARGGQIPHYNDGGDFLHDILGTAGSALGSMIPIPYAGPALGRFLGHAGANVISGQTDNIDNDAAHDFTMGMMRRGGRVDCGPEHDWKVRRGDITARFTDGGPISPLEYIPERREPLSNDAQEIAIRRLLGSLGMGNNRHLEDAVNTADRYRRMGTR